ncbi:MAG: rpsA 1 [Gammaproteobacteria bacterium]|jgi:small subunit ribosomal protein S1|nr:rpsA 1 [Gammaproteobacteria bacterium]MCE3238646.1 rpsA 1 [Gammaproteobacteria bacterium]
MAESFAQLFEESLNETPMLPGAIIIGKITRIEGGFVWVSAGLKSESTIPISQFQDEHGNLEVAVGDEVQVALEAIEDGFGITRLSRERAKRYESWGVLEKAYEKKENVRGIIQGRVKGGFTVEIKDIRAFLPGSLVDVKPIRDPDGLLGKEFDFKVIKIDAKRNNIVVSRRSAMEAENSVEREALLESLHEGDVVIGTVKNLTDYGAFIDLGGLDGLLHITDISHKRMKHPSEVLSIGDEIKVKILKFDRSSARVSLGLKQLGDDPWSDIAVRYPVGQRLSGRITNITDYGCFVEIEEGIEGLVHVSEMDWTNKNINPNKVVHLGQEVDVIVLDINVERRRISLGLKQCTQNPWETFAANHQKGDKISGKIKSITDFGIFIGLDGAIDGLIHLSDISWNEGAAEEAIRKYQKGDELNTVILAIDAERERISLGLKQLADDPIANYLNAHEKGSVVSGKVTEVDAKLATVELAEGVFGTIRASEISAEKVEDARTKLTVGDVIEARIMGTDRKTQMITLSMKNKEASTAATSKKQRSSASKKKDKSKATDTADTSMKTTLGDLFKAKMDQEGDA